MVRYHRALTRLSAFALLSVFAGLVLAAPAMAQNPPVVYLHGVTEDACSRDNLSGVLRAVGERLPQGGLPRQDEKPCDSIASGENPLRFRYVQDKHGANDKDKALGGSSQSGARRNALALREYIDRLTETDESKVMLVGFSMGGLIIRTYLADHRAHADKKVAAVVFIESALQGSLFGLAARTANSKEAQDACRVQSGFPGGSVLCSAVLALIREEFELKNEDAIAFRDLSPQSEIVRENASVSPPTGPRYLTLPGDIRYRLPRNLLGEWTFGEPNEELSLGDGVILPGDPAPSATPALGGASFKPSGGTARQVPLTQTCGLKSRDLQLLVDASLVGPLADNGAKLDCLRRSPQAHWNINAQSTEVVPGRVKNLPQVISDFLVEACLEARLGRCGPEPLAGPGEACGTVQLESFQGRPLALEVQIEEGSVTCSESRDLVTWYWTADGPCERQGAGTCLRTRGVWRCLAPTAGSYPVVVRCSTEGRALRAVDSAAFPVVGDQDCGDVPDYDSGKPAGITANFACEDAIRVAEYANVDDEELVNFECETEQLATEHVRTMCSWGDRKVSFEVSV